MCLIFGDWPDRLQRRAAIREPDAASRVAFVIFRGAEAMPMSEQDTARKRSPTRVDISYKPLQGTKKVRIPFRAGVMGNFSGHTQDLPPLREREFVTIDKFNFDKVMEGMNVTLDLNVPDTMAADKDDVFKVNLRFKKWKDFHPSEIIKQVPRLLELYQLREKLRAAKTALEVDGGIAKDLTDLMSAIDKSKADQP
jgi:type VI secretion system protein ImpB